MNILKNKLKKKKTNYSNNNGTGEQGIDLRSDCSGSRALIAGGKLETKS